MPPPHLKVVSSQHTSQIIIITSLIFSNGQDEGRGERGGGRSRDNNTIGRYFSRSDRKVEPGQIIETRFQLKC